MDAAHGLNVAKNKQPALGYSHPTLMPDLENLKHAPASLGLNELIASRWSPRSYSDKPVSSEDLTKIFTAAAWAASSTTRRAP